MNELRGQLSVLNLFVPPNISQKVMGLLAIFLGFVLGPYVNHLAEKDHAWLGHYLTVCVVAGCGFMLGHILRLVHHTPATLFVPGLMPAAIRMAVGLNLLLAFFYLAILYWHDGFNGYSPAIAIAAGAIAMTISAGVQSKLMITVYFVLIATLWHEDFQDTTLTFLSSSMSNWVLIGVAIAAWLAMSLRLRQPVDEAGADILVEPTIGRPFKLPKHAFFDDLSAADLKQPVRSAFRHSTRQSWFNEFAVIGLMTLLTSTTLIIGEGNVEDFLKATALLVIICVAYLPWFQRTLFGGIQDFLWLSGYHSTRRRLVLDVFIQMLMPPVRISIFSLAAFILLLELSAATPGSYALIPMMLLAPASSAVMLSIMLLLRNLLGRAKSGQLFIMGMATALVPALMNLIALITFTEHNLTVAVTVAAIVSIATIFSSALLTSWVLSRQREWFK